jgi:hypothetical protein
MVNLAHRSLGRLSLAILFCLSLAPFSLAQAASVAIDTLAVSTATLTVAITGDGTYSFSTPVIPPATVTMGTYQDPIVSGTGWKIYSTNLFGAPAPTGTVDGALGTINVDFSSLRGQIMTTTYGMLDFALWPLINPPSPTSTYNGTTGEFALNWSDQFSISLAGLPYPIAGTATVTLGGTVTPVPVPAALWLLGSGLIGLAGAARRHKSQ